MKNDDIQRVAQEITNTSIISFERVGPYEIRIYLADESYLCLEYAVDYMLEITHITPDIAKVVTK